MSELTAPVSETPRSLFIVEEFSCSPQAWGGVQISIRNLAAGLARDGGVTVLAPARLLPPLPRYRDHRQASQQEAAENRVYAPPEGVRVLRPKYLHLPILWHVTEPLQLLLIGLWVGLVQAGRAQIIHGHRAYPMGLLAVMLGACLRRPSVVSVYGSDVPTELLYTTRSVQFRTKAALRWAKRVVGVSRDLVERAAAAGMPPERGRFVPSGVDLERFAPRAAADARRRVGLPGDRRVLLCASRFLPIKGHALLVEAFRRLCARRDDVILVLTGDGYVRPEIEAAVRDHDLGDRVRFAGNVTRDEIPLYVAACDVLVLPSKNEGMPLCVLEAFACGRPVVCTRVGGTPEVVSDERYGILVPPYDPDALCEGLDVALAREWDAAALRARAEEFGWPRIVERLREVYREVAGG